MTTVIQEGKDGDLKHKKENALNGSVTYFGSKIKRIWRRYGKVLKRNKVVNENPKFGWQKIVDPLM